MQSLWRILGYDKVIAQLSRGLDTAENIQLLTGPPGSGKSSISSAIGHQWELAGGAPLVALGDIGRADSAYYPFNYALGGVSNHWKTIAPVMADLGQLAETLTGTRGAITSTVRSLAGIPGKRRRKRSGFLGEAAQAALHNLERHGKKKPILLIADNLHWWDRDSLTLLRQLLGDEMREAYPFLQRMRVLAVATSPRYQPVVNAGAHEALLTAGQARLMEIQRPPRDLFRQVLVSLGAPETLEPDVADEIYVMSDGHLLLAKRAAQYIGAHGSADIVVSADKDEFRRILLTERMHSLGEIGRQALELLQIASALGLSFRQDEIVCAVGRDEAETRLVLRSCREENVLAVEDRTYRFVHDLLRQHFSSVAGLDRVAVHERLSACWRVLRPGDYRARSANAVAAGNAVEAGVLAVQAALQVERRGDDWSSVLGQNFEDLINAARLGPVLDAIVAAYRSVINYDFDVCRRLLGELPHGLPEALRAEADFVRAMCLMSTRSEIDREAGRICLRAWSGLEDREPELGLRLMRQLLYGLAMMRDKTEARALEYSLRQALESRVAFDSSAIDDLYTLDRCSGSLDVPEVALMRTREAARHYSSVNGESSVRRPLDYYRALVNYGANLVCNSDYSAAVDVGDRLCNFIDEFDEGVFPRVDYAYSNYLLARYRNGDVAAEEAAAAQRALIDRYGSDRDPFYGKNALAVYLALAGRSDEALDLYSELATRLETTRRRPEPSMIYLIGSNRAVARFLAGGRIDLGGEWAEMGRILSDVAYTISPYLERRHQLLTTMFDQGRRLHPESFDRSLVEQCPHEFGPLWDNYCRAFRVPAVELWRDN